MPKGYAVLADIDGVVAVEDDLEGRRLRVISREEYREDYSLPSDFQLLVGDGQHVEAGVSLAHALSGPAGEAEGGEEEAAPAIVANISGRVEIGPESLSLSIVWVDIEERQHVVPAFGPTSWWRTELRSRQATRSPQAPLNPHDILRIRGKEELQRYLVGEVQKVYGSQGVNIHDKHIEVILRQMLRRVQVDTPGDAEFIPGQIVDRFEFQDKNAKVLAEGGEPATAKSVLLGVTRASLLTDSFLAAASFQETTRVLTEAAANGARDRLLGLKENVIIGRLIPARANISSIIEAKQLVAAQEIDGFTGPWFDVAEAPTTNGHENGHEVDEEIIPGLTEE